jgi:hypothetical protein
MVVCVLYHRKEGGLNAGSAATVLRDPRHEGSPVSGEDKAIFYPSAEDDVRCLLLRLESKY